LGRQAYLLCDILNEAIIPAVIADAPSAHTAKGRKSGHFFAVGACLRFIMR